MLHFHTELLLLLPIVEFSIRHLYGRLNVSHESRHQRGVGGFFLHGLNDPQRFFIVCDTVLCGRRRCKQHNIMPVFMDAIKAQCHGQQSTAWIIQRDGMEALLCLIRYSLHASLTEQCADSL